MRKPSPISISSPRETSTSRPSASAASASSTAAGVVVDDERRLGAGQPTQDVRDVILPRPARAGAQVVLEVRVAARDLVDPRDRLLGERSAAEVRVHDHAGRVEDAPEPRPPRRARARRARARRGRRGRRRGGSPRAPAPARSAPPSTASGSSTPRASSSTDGRSRSLHRAYFLAGCRRYLRAAPVVALDDELRRLLWIVCEMQQLHVLRRDHPAGSGASRIQSSRPLQ